MLPIAGQVVTLYKRKQTTANGRTTERYVRHILTGCSWRRVTRDSMADGAILRRNEVVCRIPIGQQMPDTGDLLILGVANAKTATARELAALSKVGDDAFIASSVADNTRAPLPHYCARG